MAFFSRSATFSLLSLLVLLHPAAGTSIPPVHVRSFVRSTCNITSSSDRFRDPANLEYVAEACENTTYSRECRTSLFFFADDIDFYDPTMACVSMSLSLYRVKSLITFFATQLHNTISRTRHAALSDCMDYLTDSKNEISASFWHTWKASAGGIDAEKTKSDAVSSMGGAAKNLETCINVISGEKDESLEQIVSRRLERAYRYLRNSMGILQRSDLAAKKF